MELLFVALRKWGNNYWEPGFSLVRSPVLTWIFVFKPSRRWGLGWLLRNFPCAALGLGPPLTLFLGKSYADATDVGLPMWGERVKCRPRSSLVKQSTNDGPNGSRMLEFITIGLLHGPKRQIGPKYGGYLGNLLKWNAISKIPRERGELGKEYYHNIREGGLLKNSEISLFGNIMYIGISQSCTKMWTT